MTLLIEANKELKALSEIIPMSDNLYDWSGIKIDLLAEESSHMGVSEFVDMCIDLARLEGDCSPFDQ